MKKNLIKLVALSTIFVFGASLTACTSDKKATNIHAAQHIDSFAPYTYSGNYYNSIDFDAATGLNGALRQAITSLSIPDAFYTYGGTGTTHLSTQLQYADEDPTDSDNMIYLYTRDSVTKNPANSWNREHVWCQSLSNGNWSGSRGDKKAGTDILHIRPVYQSTNSSRGNDLYGDNNKAIPKTYNDMVYGYKGSEYFEPLDQVKGDVARIVMYVWTTYTGYQDYNPIAITDVFESYDTLLKWHTMDKPDVLEGNRNNYAEGSIQGNRNPFVDHPELAWKIFGDSASSAVKNACMEAYPADGGSSTPPTPGPGPSGDTEYTKVASYVFSSGNSSDGEYNANTLLARFTASKQTGAGLSDIVEGISNTSKTYAGYAKYYNFGLKLGTSSANGTFTVSLSEEVDRVIVNTAGWTVTDSLTVGDASSQTPGVAYTETNPIKELTFDITASDEVTFTFAKRGFIQSIDFYVKEEATYTLDDYLSTVSTLATLHGKETINNADVDSITFADQGLNNGTQYLNPFTSDAGDFTVTFAGGGNDGKYYNTGSGIRTYGDGTITIASSEPMTKVIMTWDTPSDNKPASANVVNVGTYNPSTYTWTGSSTSVVFTRPTGSGHWRLQAVQVSIGETIVTVDSVSLRFAAFISESNWNAIKASWTINDYGVMLVKKNTLLNTYHASTVEEAYNNGETLAVARKGSGADPYLEEGNYSFSSIVNVKSDTNYGMEFCAAPFIVVDDTYYFLDEMCGSVNSLAEYYLDHDGCSLSHAALEQLVGDND